MSTYSVRILCGLNQLAEQASAWDALVERSAAVPPLARAAQVARWQESFARGATWRAIAVSDGPRMVAALPLYGRRHRRLLPVGSLPGNAWTPGGKLLVDPQAEPAMMAQQLAKGLANLPWPLLILEGVDIASPPWSDVLREFGGLSMRWQYQPWFPVGTVERPPSWADYLATRSRNLRHDLRRKRSRLERCGKLELRHLRPHDADEALPLVSACWELEQRGWKGTARGSVAQHPEVAAYFHQQAADLAVRGQLDLALLELDGRPIAFHYAFWDRGVYWLLKIGYDEALEQHSPGQVLLAAVLERLCADAEFCRLDFLGPLSSATARWHTGSYEVGRLVIARPGRWGGLLFSAFRRWEARHRPAPEIGSPQTALLTAIVPDDTAEPDAALAAAER